MKKIFILIMAVLLLVGCSSHKEAAYKDSYDGGSNYDDYYYAPTIDTKDIGTSVDYIPESAESYYAGDEEISRNDKPVNQNEQKLVYTSKMTLETKQYDDLIKEVTALVAKYEGFNEYIREMTDSRRTTTMTVRIPSAHFDEFIEELRNGSGSVADISINVDNITEYYNNTALRIQTLETQHKRLLELLKDADELEQIILLEDRLSEVEYELEMYNNQLNGMDSRVSYSTISIVIREVVIYTEVRSTFLQRLADAFRGSWDNFTESLGDFVIDVIYALPGLIILAAVLFLFRKPIAGLWNRRKDVKSFRIGKKNKTAEVKDSEENDKPEL